MLRSYSLTLGSLPTLLGVAMLTARLAVAACPECNADGRVSIDELVTGINIALGTAELSACVALDTNGDGRVSIDELVVAIGAALSGCDADPTATPTPTSMSTAVATATSTAVNPPAPTEPGALRDWLQAGNYLGWMRESAPHPSTGPHGGTVRTYLNDPLFESLSNELPAHPAGATAVKELYRNGTTVIGWAVMVKVDGDSAGGQGWYWYEAFGNGAPFSGVGLAVCTGCHAQGRDFIRIPFPLQ